MKKIYLFYVVVEIINGGKYPFPMVAELDESDSVEEFLNEALIGWRGDEEDVEVDDRNVYSDGEYCWHLIRHNIITEEEFNVLTKFI